MSDAAAILLFAKAPIIGTVKSRLAAQLGEAAALELYRAFGLDLMEAVDSIGADCTVFVHPPEGLDAAAEWLGRHRRYRPQEGGDLGQRMENAFRAAFDGGTDRAILIGSDLPDLPADVLRSSLESLRGKNAVLGPAADGGYYLIGFRKDSFHPAAFHSIAWSTNTVFRDTRDCLARSNLQFQVAREWRDVDTVDDLQDLVWRNTSGAFERSRSLPLARRLYATMKPS